MKRNWI